MCLFDDDIYDSELTSNWREFTKNTDGAAEKILKKNNR